MTYIVQTAASCGMTIPHGEFEELDEAIERVEARIGWLINQMGAEVVKLDKRNWEVLDDGFALVPDFCGVLQIKEVVEPEVDYDDPDLFDETED